MTIQLDTSVFCDLPPAEEIAAQKPTGVAGLMTGSKLVLAGFAAACLAVWLVCSLGIAGAAVSSFGLDVSAVNVGSGIFLAGVLAAAVGFLRQGPVEDPRIAAAKLHRFVHRNGLSYTADPKLPKIEATIFGEGHHPQCAQRFRNGPAHAFPFEVAHFSSRNDPLSRNRNNRVFFTRGKLDLHREETWERLSRVIFGPGAALVDSANGPASAQRFASSAQPGAPGGRTLKRRTLTPALLWTMGGFAVLVLARILLTGPLNGLI